MDIGKILIEKLTKEELNLFCKMWDDGSFRDVVEQLLIPEDVKNFPEEYITQILKEE